MADEFGNHLAQLVVGLMALTAATAFLGTFIMQFFVKQVPFSMLALICGWASLRVLIFYAVALDVVVSARIQIPPDFGWPITILGMGAIGWLVTSSLERFRITSSVSGLAPLSLPGTLHDQRVPGSSSPPSFSSRNPSPI